MAEPKPPSRERQRQMAQIARDNRTIFTQIRAFFRAPETIDTLLILNVISKFFMVTAVVFMWARTRPLGSFGRNVLGGHIFFSPFVCADGAWRFSEDKNLIKFDCVSVCLCLTRAGSVAFLTVSDIGITQLLWEFNDLQSWRLDPPQNDVAIQAEPENIKMTRVVVEREEAAAALPSLEFVGVRSLRAIEERNRLPRVAVQSDAPPAPPSFEFERARPRPVGQSALHPNVGEETHVKKKTGPRVTFKLPVVKPETPPGTEGESDAASSLPSYDSETTPSPPDSEESLRAPSPPDSEESVRTLSVSSLRSDASTAIPEVAEESYSSDTALKSAIARTISKVAERRKYVSEPSLRSDASTAVSEAAEERDSASEPPLKFGTAATISEVSEEAASASASEPALKSGVVTTISEVAEVKNSASEPSLKSEVTGEKCSALEPALKSGIAATLQKIGEKKAADSLLSQKFDTVVTEQEVEEESPRAGSNLRNLWGKVKGLKKSSGRRQSNDRNSGHGQNQGSNRNNGRDWAHVNDSGGQSDSNHDWDAIKENPDPSKDDTPKDSSDD
ncbi:uncharacterized protein Triagg1_1105 [Trichoderma aggressivum f. europaeum]|uniref:Uncharacterized protein n=1 Tax=Trichoderma aggressivum f. europaeum TaxID=173218 RepID=A0AAE1IMP3_9HYPO|nr:hypothetical protein Triagg1_1105 [Trichoderma aggressivum f. europaeum]